MLFGEFIYADGVEVLSGTSLIMYWLYAISFMLLGILSVSIFFLALTGIAGFDRSRHQTMEIIRKVCLYAQ